MSMQYDDNQVKKVLRRRTVRAFAVFILLGMIAVFGLRSLYRTPREKGDAYIQPPLRKTLQANERLFTSTFDPDKLAKTYPVGAAVKNVRVNGNVGMNQQFDTAGWQLKVVRHPGDTLMLTMADIKRLPKTEIVFNFKCIEGWSQITHWGGVKFSDFLHAYGLDSLALKKFIGLATPDGAYYVGIDMASAIHPQTLLCYEMSGKPLPKIQGAPLRLIIPVKYGIKHLKRIGTLFFSDTPPRDYWAERGYDYYAGH
jgi:DMSO/TMAO reductase YedYZ molybdopterin-dependent catalytic subunit